MKKNENIGKTIIDKLKVCYTVADPTVLEHLKTCEIESYVNFAGFVLKRIASDTYFKFVFQISYKDQEENWREFGRLKFGDPLNQKQYFLIHVENRVLYDYSVLQNIYNITETLGLKFNNFTKLDLAKDFTKDIVKFIKKHYKDPSLTTIVNNKAIKDRDAVIPTLRFTHSVSLNKLKHPTFNAYQAKAADNPKDGIVVSAYNKAAEIRHKSGKQYILDVYDNPKRLHRLEVGLNREELQYYFSNVVNTKASFEIIYDQDFITEMFFYHLSSVIRFSKGRTPIKWEDILH